MELRDALTQISEIRLQMARTEVFRGYRAVPVAFSGLLAIVAAVVQPLLVPVPAEHLSAYLTLWVCAAVISLSVAGGAMWIHCVKSDSPLRKDITWLAVEQFLPGLVAGVLVTFVLVGFVPSSAGLLPGLWQVLFSLGVFASARLLPRATFWVAVFYLCTGICCLALSSDAVALSPWAMGLPFGAGQLFSAAVLYWTLERNDGSR